MTLCFGNGTNGALSSARTLHARNEREREREASYGAMTPQAFVCPADGRTYLGCRSEQATVRRAAYWMAEAVPLFLPVRLTPPPPCVCSIFYHCQFVHFWSVVLLADSLGWAIHSSCL